MVKEKETKPKKSPAKLSTPVKKLAKPKKEEI